LAEAASESAGALDRAVQQQKSRVVAESDKLGRLSQLQNEVNLRRDQYTKATQKVAELREEAAIADTGLTPLGPASTPKAATFPNKLLIIPGSVAMGFVLGVLLSLLLELLNRRVRGVEDLRGFDNPPVLAVIAAPPRPSRRGARSQRTAFAPPELSTTGVGG
jgi:uncharacterized protein involved in exopolysaccharide biosynthesis